MSLADHKAKLMIMLGGKKPPADDEADEPEADAGEEGIKAAMGDFIAAVKSGDVDAACDAFGQLKEY